MKSKNNTAILPLLLLGACAGGGGLDELPPAPTGEGPDGPPPSQQWRDQGAPPPSDGPQGSSQMRPGEERYDRVGYAGYAGTGEGVFALSGVLPAGSHAEVTALDTGKTMLIQIRGQGRGLLELSGAAARQLGVTGNPPVRVRRVTVTPQDAALLASGQPAPMRADAPPALLAGLRRRLGEQPATRSSDRPSAPPPAAASRRPPGPPPAQPSSTARGLFVQVAALSNAQRAQALATELGGVVRSSGSLHRVQIGPFPNSAAAERARADVARRGFSDARVISVP